MSPAVYRYHVQATLRPLSLHGACRYLCDLKNMLYISRL